MRTLLQRLRLALLLGVIALRLAAIAPSFMPAAHGSPSSDTALRTVREVSQKRIDSAASRTGSILASAPEQVVNVTVSLHQPVSVTRLAEALTKHPGQVVELWHGFVAGRNVFRGGYALAPDETLDSAVTSYGTDFVGILERQLVALRRRQAATPDKSLRALIEDLESRVQATRASGALIYGFALRGPAAQVISYARALSFNKVVEAVTHERPAEPIFFLGGDY